MNATDDQDFFDAQARAMQDKIASDAARPTLPPPSVRRLGDTGANLPGAIGNQASRDTPRDPAKFRGMGETSSAKNYRAIGDQAPPLPELQAAMPAAAPAQAPAAGQVSVPPNQLAATIAGV